MNELRYAMAFVAIGLCFSTGCGSRGDRPELGLVSGVVKMDGEPLKNALVAFGPTSGRASQGVTDAQGRYELDYIAKVKGAKLGSHIVSITTFYEDEDSPAALSAVETIPDIYNTKTTLKEEVKPGKNTINFDLKSKP